MTFTATRFGKYELSATAVDTVGIRKYKQLQKLGKHFQPLFDKLDSFNVDARITGYGLKDGLTNWRCTIVNELPRTGAKPKMPGAPMALVYLNDNAKEYTSAHRDTLLVLKGTSPYTIIRNAMEQGLRLAEKIPANKNKVAELEAFRLDIQKALLGYLGFRQ